VSNCKQIGHRLLSTERLRRIAHSADSSTGWLSSDLHLQDGSLRLREQGRDGRHRLDAGGGREGEVGLLAWWQGEYGAGWDVIHGLGGDWSAACAMVRVFLRAGCAPPSEPPQRRLHSPPPTNPVATRARASQHTTDGDQVQRQTSLRNAAVVSLTALDSREMAGPRPREPRERRLGLRFGSLVTHAARWSRLR
jgi:hypothetical protein